MLFEGKGIGAGAGVRRWWAEHCVLPGKTALAPTRWPSSCERDLSTRTPHEPPHILELCSGERHVIRKAQLSKDVPHIIHSIFLLRSRASAHLSKRR